MNSQQFETGKKYLAASSKYQRITPSKTAIEIVRRSEKSVWIKGGPYRKYECLRCILYAAGGEEYIRPEKNMIYTASKLCEC